MDHLILYPLSLSFKSHTYLESSVSDEYVRLIKRLFVISVSNLELRGSHSNVFFGSLRGRPSVLWGPDLQRAGFWRARGRIEGLQESPPFMTTRPSHNIINSFLKLTNRNSAAIGENPGRKKYLRLHVNMSIKQCRELLRTIIAESVNVVLRWSYTLKTFFFV